MDSTKDTTYHGWSNYATWRIKLELWDDDSMWKENVYEDIHAFADSIKDTTEEILDNDTRREDNQLVLSYALAFIQDVNWYEIAKHIAEDYPQIIKK